jgi:hypothetical protein
MSLELLFHVNKEITDDFSANLSNGNQDKFIGTQEGGIYCGKLRLHGMLE